MSVMTYNIRNGAIPWQNMTSYLMAIEIFAFFSRYLSQQPFEIFDLDNFSQDH